jgi:hypothetical protein
VPIEPLPHIRETGGVCFANQNYQCTIQVEFGSECCGPDSELSAKIHEYVLASPRIAAAARCPIGREGEYRLCLNLPDRSEAKSVYVDLQQILRSARGRPHANVTLTFAD